MIRALSVRQPWASLIAEGRKTIETRSWRTSYRGPLLIVSTKRPDISPAGQALCLVELVDCRPMTPDDERAAGCPWRDGAWSWVLVWVRRVEMSPVTGRQGLFFVDGG
jgi:hypothetical protein